jgi:hypothetical protein
MQARTTIKNEFETQSKAVNAAAAAKNVEREAGIISRVHIRGDFFLLRDPFC